VDEAVVDAGFLGQPPGGDPGGADLYEQPLGRVEQGLLGSRARRRRPGGLGYVSSQSAFAIASISAFLPDFATGRGSSARRRQRPPP
jgi:hypothetical protein